MQEDFELSPTDAAFLSLAAIPQPEVAGLRDSQGWRHGVPRKSEGLLNSPSLLVIITSCLLSRAFFFLRNRSLSRKSTLDLLSFFDLFFALL